MHPASSSQVSPKSHRLSRFHTLLMDMENCQSRKMPSSRGRLGNWVSVHGWQNRSTAWQRGMHYVLRRQDRIAGAHCVRAQDLDVKKALRWKWFDFCSLRNAPTVNRYGRHAVSDKNHWSSLPASRCGSPKFLPAAPSKTSILFSCLLPANFQLTVLMLSACQFLRPCLGRTSLASSR